MCSVSSLWGCWQFGCSSTAWHCREVKVLRLHLFPFTSSKGFASLLPTLHQGTRRWMKMLDGMRADCESCCSTWRKAQVTEMIFPISLSVTGVHLLPRWKISLIELPQSDSTIIVEMKLWNGRCSIKWLLKPWAFQIDCKVDKRPCDRCPASSWVTLTFTFFTSKLSACLRKLKQIGFQNQIISPLQDAYS